MKVKKFLKSKIAVAILAVVIVSSVLMAGTYSWFVATNGGGEADIKSATLTLEQKDLDGNTTTPTYFVARNLTGDDVPGVLGEWDLTVVVPITKKDSINANEIKDHPLYAGEAIGSESQYLLKNDRAAIVRIDFGSNTSTINTAKGIFNAALLAKYTDASVTVDSDFTPTYSYSDGIKTAYTGDALPVKEELIAQFDIKIKGYVLPWNNSNTNLVGNNIFLYTDLISGAYYIYFPARVDDPANIEISSLLGIRGKGYDQNILEGITLQDINVLPVVTVVQATEQAVKDVFGNAVATNLNTKGWFGDSPTA